MASKILLFFRNLIHQEDGITAIEYALIAGAILVAIYLIVGKVGTSSSATFSAINSAI
ncbi:Flp family type IVb pilin [Polynucleobacter sp. MWH-Braz-FAM2G]|uniref:Flp family type IVb pilin n=1 Tax=Polynucleobacter sp. MWH-Braz-FAM2G TaxID=1855883 RepID=UPI001BFCE18D|nr:Flp family type IVb pilin [Polynucleobacter sp. MWH-Braz-FAM2G]QWD90312.1 Flp family type IVb pilin [Polynucleobacter sp. MWH-Braz-FAM2G]